MSSEIKQLELEFEGTLKKYNGGNTTEYGSFYKKHCHYDTFIMTIYVNNKIYDVWLYGVKNSFVIITSFGDSKTHEIAFAWEGGISMFADHKIFTVGGCYRDTSNIISSGAAQLYKTAEAILIEEDLLNKEWP